MIDWVYEFLSSNADLLPDHSIDNVTGNTLQNMQRNSEEARAKVMWEMFSWKLSTKSYGL